MSGGMECEIARAGASAVTRRDPGGTLRATLSAADGVPIEAAYTPCGAGAAPYATVLAHGFTGALERPALRRAAAVLARHSAVVTFSFRGHGGSGGRSTVGDREVLDLAAAVRWARSLGHGHVVTVGFSMGGSVVLRHGALYRPDRTDGDADDNTACADLYTKHGGRAGAHDGALVHMPDMEPLSAHADAVVSVSAPARWYYRGTAPMRRLHWAIQRPVGRLVSRYGLRTRVHPHDWDPVPLSPVAAAPLISPAPLLVVHGDRDPYFPLDHPRSLAAAADPERSELWIEPGFGHAENAADPALLHRIGSWAGARCREPGAARHHGSRNADG
ncbi:alpha/beta hydrolase family protein [Streptomyces sp. NPDC054796]